MSSVGERSDRDEAFTVFVRLHGHALRRYAYVLTGEASAADDLLQASLGKLYLAWDKVAAPDARLAYARRTMARTQASWWRRPVRRERPAADPPEPTRPGPDGAAALRTVDDRDEVWRLLATLPPRTRAVLVLRYYEDLPEADIAAALGCSVGSVKSQLSRGLARLRLQRATGASSQPSHDASAPEVTR
ncbi:MAG: SigE family RNA polymerase sigma factor [Austwickia sp.]|jgi:RNA polymerase sigma-70 factor (sigma-E family)|nr:MAG: SigE family RNA polymerase sigma factor [Austwickia sp.]